MFELYGLSINASEPSCVLLKWRTRLLVAVAAAVAVVVVPAAVDVGFALEIVVAVQPEMVGPVRAPFVPTTAAYAGIRLTAAAASRRPTGRFSLGCIGLVRCHRNIIHTSSVPS